MAETDAAAGGKHSQLVQFHLPPVGQRASTGVNRMSYIMLWDCLHVYLMYEFGTDVYARDIRYRNQD